MITPENGIPLIERFEGCPLKAYKDGGGILTIARGHTEGVKEGDTCTQEQADAWFMEDLARAERRLNGMLKIEINQFERDSLISQAYNIASFHTLINHLNDEGREVYLQELLLYVNANGKPEKGLVLRRKAEWLLFQGMAWEEIVKEMSL
jgi:lysozyme